MAEAALHSVLEEADTTFTAGTTGLPLENAIHEATDNSPTGSASTANPEDKDEALDMVEMDLPELEHKQESNRLRARQSSVRSRGAAEPTLSMSRSPGPPASPRITDPPAWSSGIATTRQALPFIEPKIERDPKTRGRPASVLKRLKLGRSKETARRGDIRLPPGEKTQRLMTVLLWIVLLMGGWNDASAGPLVPKLQTFYGVNYAIISLVYVINFGGIFLSSLIVGPLTDRIGFAWVATVGLAIQTAAYAILGSGPPYPVFCLGYFVSGMGNSLYIAQVNSMLSRLPNPALKLSCGHGLYGLGAAVAPLVATQFATRVERVTLYYFASMGISTALCACIALTFRGRRAEEIIPLSHQQAMEESEIRRGLTQRTPATSQAPTRRPSFESAGAITPGVGHIPNPLEHSGVLDRLEAIRMEEVELQRVGTLPLPTEMPTVEEKKDLFTIIRLRIVQLMAVYLFLYVGVEVGLGAWTTSFLEEIKHGTPASGYAVSGYFAGIGVGRLTLIPVTKLASRAFHDDRLGNNWAIVLYTSVCIAMLIVNWTVPNVIANGVAISIAGFCLGPIYPISVETLSFHTPRRIGTAAVGLVASMGAGGSALIPFAIGMLAQGFTIFVLNPFMITCLALSLIVFIFISRM